MILYTHKWHPISHPYGWAMGCLLWGFWRKLTTGLILGLLSNTVSHWLGANPESVLWLHFNATALFLVITDSDNGMSPTCTQPLSEQVLDFGAKYHYCNPLRAKFCWWNIKHIFTFYVIRPHWYDSGDWNPSSNKTRAYPFYIVNIIAADVLAPCVARTSAAMILT